MRRHRVLENAMDTAACFDLGPSTRGPRRRASPPPSPSRARPSRTRSEVRRAAKEKRTRALAEALEKTNERLTALVAANMVRMRRERAMTVAEVARRGGLHVRHMQKVEAGTLNLTLATLAKLAKVFALDPEELLTPLPRRARGARRREVKRRRPRGG